MLKYKILNTDKDNFIELPINLDFDPMDNSELIEEFIREERRKALNTKQDKEVIRYKPGLLNPLKNTNPPFVRGDKFNIRLSVWFYDCDALGVFNINIIPGFGFNYMLDYKGNDLLTDKSKDDDRLKKGFEKSFYTLDFYDTNNRSTQTKLFTSIIPTVPPKEIDKKTITSDFVIREQDIGYHIYYLKELDFNVDIFMKLTFFNGITGRRTSFFNDTETNIQGIGNPQQMKNTLPLPEEYKDSMLYFRYRINENFTYDIIDSNPLVVNDLLVKQINAIEVRFK